MDKRQVIRIGMCMLCAATWCAVASAELNLWVSYHYSGTESYAAADFADAQTLLTEAKSETETTYRVANTLDALGMTNAARGSYADAEQCYEEALCMLEKSMGKRSRDIPRVLNNLADLHYIAGDPEQVECLYRRALDINERDQWNVEVCRSLNGLALLHNDAGEYVQAEKLLKQAIDIHVRSQRREHPYLATVLVNLAVLYTNLGRYDEAAPLFDQAKYIQDTVLRADHPDVAIRLHAYAGYLVTSGGCPEMARKAQEHAEAIQAKQAEANPIQ